MDAKHTEEATSLINEVINKQKELSNPSKESVCIEILVDLNDQFLINKIPFEKDYDIKEHMDWLKEETIETRKDDPPFLSIEYKSENTWEVGFVHEPRLSATVDMDTASIYPLLEYAISKDLTYGLRIHDSS